MNTKSLFTAFVAAFAFCLVTEAQIIREDELEKYAIEKYGDDWEEAALKIANEHPLDANHAFSFTEVLQAPGMDANQIYDELLVWFTSTFVDANSVLVSKERERGLIVARGFIDGTGSSTGAFTSVFINVTPTIKIQIKDGRIRVTYSVPFYIENKVGAGIVGAFGGVVDRSVETNNVVLDKSFPYGELEGGNKRARRRAQGRALAMSNAYANVVLDKIDKVIKEGYDGTANDEW